MRLKVLVFVSAVFLPSIPLAAQTPAADHLVISELSPAAVSGFNSAPTSAEFVEIYNPTSSTISLDNYFVSDYNKYYNLPGVVAGTNGLTSPILTGTSDHLAQFPPGYSLTPGQVAVVTENGQSLVDAYYGGLAAYQALPGSPLIFSMYDVGPSIPQMISYNGDATVNGQTNFNKTDAGESEFLFYWDGQSSLVQDVDMVSYIRKGFTASGGNYPTNKGGISVTGPSFVTGTYNDDNGIATGNLVATVIGGEYNQVVRRTLLEAGQTQSGGNGIYGEDETMEFCDETFIAVQGAPINSTPGTTNLGLASANQAPVIVNAQRSVKYPAPGTTVHISANIYDDGPFTANLLVDTGSGFTTTTMVSEGNDSYGADIDTTGLSDKTHIKWYVEATDDQGLAATESDYTHMGQDYPGYHVVVVQNAPPTASDLIINEIVQDPVSTDNGDRTEWVELYNPSSSPFDAGSIVMGVDSDDGPPSGSNPWVFYDVRIPEGTIIPPNGYLVIAGRKNLFRKDFHGFDSNPLVIDAKWPVGVSVLTNGDNHHVLLYQPDDYDFNDGLAPTAFEDVTVNHSVPGAPVNNTGFSIELIDPNADNTNTNNGNWQPSKIYGGTPMSINSNFKQGDILVDSTRDLEFPGSTSNITISAGVTSTNAISSVELMVDSGSGFASAGAMTLDSGTTYTKVIGPFPDGTPVKYYVKATDSAGNTGTFPYIAPLDYGYFMVEDNPPTSADLVINEIMYDPFGSDNTNYPEYIELYNRRATPINISFYEINYSGTPGLNEGTYGRILPADTIIAPNGYILLSNQPLFSNCYHEVDPSIVYEADWKPSSIVANSGTPYVSLVHANAYLWQGQSSVDMEGVAYSPVSAPWPANDAGGLNGPSIELTSPELDVSVGSNWHMSTPFQRTSDGLPGPWGTPGAVNSTTPPAGIGDWAMY